MNPAPNAMTADACLSAMYEIFLLLHSWNRWIVLVFGLAAVIAVFANKRTQTPWTATNDRLSLIFLIAADVQLLLGVTLFAMTPWLGVFFRGPGTAMSNELVRYWTVEHGFGMIVAIVFAHIGRASIRRKSDAPAKSRAAALWLTLSILTILVTIPWPFMRYGRPLLRL